MRKISFKTRKCLAALLVLAVVFSLFGTAAPMTANAYETDHFRDDFNGTSLDPNKWMIAYKNWGGKDSSGNDYNGGVNPQNVSVSNGTLKLEAHGNLYTDPSGKMVKGINKDGSIRDDGKRVGAAIATRDYFSSGKYEVRMKIPQQLGVCSAIWTYYYGEYYEGDSVYLDALERNALIDDSYYAVNHEIDIELPGRPGPAKTGMSYDYALCNTWRGEGDSEMTTNYTNVKNALGYGLADGQFHTYRFDWHTGGDGQTAKVDFYIDNVLVKTNTTNVPTNASRLWLAVWFPNQWAGTPDFNTTVTEVDYVDIQPFNQANDTWQSESFPLDGWYGTNPLPEKSKTSFTDDFTKGLDPGKWLIANKNWGGQLGAVQSYNGGVIPENVKISNGNLVLEAHGDKYQGNIMGLNNKAKTAVKAADGKKAGAAVATNDYYASGRYEVIAKIPTQLGLCSAFWTFNYKEYYEGDPIYEQKLAEGKVLKLKALTSTGQTGLVDADWYAENHEIDIELPGRPGPEKTGINYNYALCNTWLGETEEESTTNYTSLTPAIGAGKPNGVADGQFHKFRFDWHTGGSGITPRVEFYVDDVLVKTCTTNIPTKASRFWMAAWFPNKWAGNPNFDTQQLEIKSVSITPFNEPNDDYSASESFPTDGWASMYQYPGYTFTEDEGGQTVPAVPAGLAAVPEGSSAVNVSWNTVSGASSYDLRIDGAIVTGVSTPYNHTGLAANSTHTYEVRAVNSAGASAWSQAVSATTQQSPALAVPTGLAASAAGTSVINVSWNTVQGATGYDLLITLPDNSAYTVTDAVSPYAHTGLNAGTTYKYQVRAKNSSEQSGWSAQVSATTSLPAQPSLINNGDFSDGSNGWSLSGSASIQNGAASLNSGGDTDVIEQIVTVLPNTSYVLSADIIANGVSVDLGVHDYNGRYSDLAGHFNTNGNGTLSFTTGADTTQLTVYVQVLRYQENLGPATIDNVGLSVQ